MSVARHRIAAGAILTFASMGLIGVGNWLIRDTPEVAKIRTQLDGKWVATRVEAAKSLVADGERASRTLVEFRGRQVHFQGLVDADEASGVYNLDPTRAPGKVDFKVDAGWMMGAYALRGDTLTLCVNALRLPEQLGVPTLSRPDRLELTPGRFLYEFRRETP